jgi:hypothetical protein
LLFVKNTFSGLFNRYNKVPYAFPVTVTISGLGMLSDTIICRAKWNNPGILYERNVMLGDNRQITQEYITKWRRNAIFKVIRTF